MMKNRKDTPDIMGDLMKGGAMDVEINKAIKPENQPAIKQEISVGALPEEPKAALVRDSNKAIKQVSQRGGQAGYTASNKTIMDAPKEKATFNLSLDTLEALEEAWIKLRRKLKGEQRVTKTQIVEKAIEIALSDLEAKSELSDLYIKLKD